MKLSKKGMLKLKSFVLIMNNFNVTTEDIKFEPNDFEGAVMLTVGEAKAIQKLIRHCYFLTNKPEIEEFAVKHDWILKTCIEQAEKCYE